MKLIKVELILETFDDADIVDVVNNVAVNDNEDSIISNVIEVNAEVVHD